MTLQTVVAAGNDPVREQLCALIRCPTIPVPHDRVIQSKSFDVANQLLVGKRRSEWVKTTRTYLRRGRQAIRSCPTGEQRSVFSLGPQTFLVRLPAEDNANLQPSFARGNLLSTLPANALNFNESALAVDSDAIRSACDDLSELLAFDVTERPRGAFD